MDTHLAEFMPWKITSFPPGTYLSLEIRHIGDSSPPDFQKKYRPSATVHTTHGLVATITLIRIVKHSLSSAALGTKVFAEGVIRPAGE